MMLKLIIDQQKIHLLEEEFGHERVSYECSLAEYENMVEEIRQRLKSVASKRVGSRVRIYRFFNLVTEKHGAEFALCDQHRLEYRPPDQCDLTKISDRTDRPCNSCARVLFNS